MTAVTATTKKTAAARRSAANPSHTADLFVVILTFWSIIAAVIVMVEPVIVDAARPESGRTRIVAQKDIAADAPLLARAD